MREIPDGLRIYQGETVAGQAWGNAAYQLSGSFRIFYDDGTEDIWSIDRIALDATRKRTGLASKRVARMDGWVNAGSVWQVAGANNSTAAQRGGCYVQVGIMSGAPGDSTGIFPEIRVQLARGYCYLGHPVALGENVEPGPTGGSGHIRHLSVSATAIGAAGGLVLAVVPTNAMWRWLYGNSTYVASATVGTRLVVVRFRDNAQNISVRAGQINLTATQSGTFEFAPNLTSEQSVNLDPIGTGSDEFPSPDRALPAAYDVIIVDRANIDFTLDTATLEADVEEWVVPGL